MNHASSNDFEVQLAWRTVGVACLWWQPAAALLSGCRPRQLSVWRRQLLRQSARGTQPPSSTVVSGCISFTSMAACAVSPVCRGSLLLLSSEDAGHASCLSGEV